MPVVLHGIIADGAPHPVGVPAHERWSAAGVAGLVTEAPPNLLSDADGMQTMEAGLAHNALLFAYTSVTAVVPVRFGALFSGEPTVADMLQRQATPLRAALKRLGRAREYGVSLWIQPTQAGPRAQVVAETGRAFLRQKKARQRARHTLAEAQSRFVDGLEVALRGQSRAVHATGRTGAGRLADFATLVASEGETRFRASASHWMAQAAELGLDLRLGGPWPAYSFSTEVLDV